MRGWVVMPVPTARPLTKSHDSADFARDASIALFPKLELLNSANSTRPLRKRIVDTQETLRWL